MKKKDSYPALVITNAAARPMRRRAALLRKLFRCTASHVRYGSANMRPEFAKPDKLQDMVARVQRREQLAPSLGLQVVHQAARAALWPRTGVPAAHPCLFMRAGDVNRPPIARAE